MKDLLTIILGSTGSIAMLFLIIFGAIQDMPALYTPGIAALTSIISALLMYNYKQGEIDNLKELLRKEQFRKISLFKGE